MIRPALILLAVVALLGCRNAPQLAAPPYERMRGYLDAKEFHEAILLWPEVEEDMRDVNEGAAGLELQLLISRTSGVGQEDWPAIFMDPNIPLGLKEDLLSEIQESAEKGMYRGNPSDGPNR